MTQTLWIVTKTDPDGQLAEQRPYVFTHKADAEKHIKNDSGCTYDPDADCDCEDGGRGYNDTGATVYEVQVVSTFSVKRPKDFIWTRK